MIKKINQLNKSKIEQPRRPEDLWQRLYPQCAMKVEFSESRISMNVRVCHKVSMKKKRKGRGGKGGVWGGYIVFLGKEGNRGIWPMANWEAGRRLQAGAGVEE